MLYPAAASQFRRPRRGWVDTIGAGDAFGAGFLARWLGLGLSRREPWLAELS